MKSELDFWVGVAVDYSFAPFNCSFGCDIEYLILNEDFYAKLQEGYGSGLQFDPVKDSVEGLKIKDEASYDNDNEIKIELDTTVETTYKFYIMGLAKNQSQINYTSPEMIQLDVIEKQFSQAPFFKEEIEDQRYEYDGTS